MIFCGQCGYQLKPGNISCPNCGANVDPDPALANLHPEEPTVSIPPDYSGTLPTQPQQGQPLPQKVIIPETQNTPIPQGPPIQRQQNTPIPQQSFTPPPYANNAYNGYPAPGGPYSNPGVGYPSGSPYPGQLPGYPQQQQMGGYATYYPPAQNAYAQPERRRSGCGIVAALAALLLVVLVGATFVVLKQNGTLSHYLNNQGNQPQPTQQPQQPVAGNTPAGITPTTAPTSTPTPTPTKTPEQSASDLVKQYYVYINQKDYQSAYNLLGTDFQNQQPYAQFANGYAHTQHDGITISQSTALGDGTVRVDMTIVATEDTGQRTLTGYDLVGQENGSWKILSGHF